MFRFFDRAPAHLMVHGVEEGAKAAHEFWQRSSTLQSDHALRRVYAYLEDLEDAGYADVQVVRDFREALKDTSSFSYSGGAPHEKWAKKKRVFSSH